MPEVSGVPLRAALISTAPAASGASFEQFAHQLLAAAGQCRVFPFSFGSMPWKCQRLNGGFRLRYGRTCPRWVVRGVPQAWQVHTQVPGCRMKPPTPSPEPSIRRRLHEQYSRNWRGLGAKSETRSARYADDLDPKASSATPVGVSCRLCERLVAVQCPPASRPDNSG